MLDVSSPDEAAASPKMQVRNTLCHLMPWMEPYWTRPLSDYAAAVYEVGRFRSQSRSRRHAMSLFRSCIERVAIRSGYSNEEARAAGRQLSDAPVIQTGPHCHLLLAPDAFYTHLFCTMGLKAHRRRWHIYHSDITVKFVEKAKKGPGWLTLDGKPVNVFGLSRSRMMPFSICAQNGPYHFELANAAETDLVNEAAERLKRILGNGRYPSAAEAIRSANLSLWTQRFEPSVSLLQFDDFDIADLIAVHLRNGKSWLASRFVGDGVFASAVIDEMNTLDTGKWAGWFKSTTHFFWRLLEGRIFPLFLRNGYLEDDRSGFKIAFRPDSLIRALDMRLLVPNMFTSFLVTSILPGIRVLGGSRQTVYYPLMRYVLANAIKMHFGDNDPLLDDMRRDVRPGVWGHRVLTPVQGDPFAEIEAVSGDARLEELLDSYGALTLRESSGELPSFIEDVAWTGLAKALADGSASRHSPEWQWAGAA